MYEKSEQHLIKAYSVSIDHAWTLACHIHCNQQLTTSCCFQKFLISTLISFSAGDTNIWRNIYAFIQYSILLSKILKHDQFLRARQFCLTLICMIIDGKISFLHPGTRHHLIVKTGLALTVVLYYFTTFSGILPL